MNDPIIDEVRRARREFEDEHNNDWDRLVRYLIEKQKSQTFKVVSYPRKNLPDRDVA
jgi:hypothetical protein